jgi:predicted component of type VI protein secretion system
MAAQLLSLTGGPSILLQKPIVLIGRHPECDIQIDSRKISRRHCCIAQVSDYLVVRDLGSTNGIRINGARVQEGKLKPNDELMIGANRYRLEWDGLAPAVLPAVAAAPVDEESEPPSPLVHEEARKNGEPVPLAEPVDLPTAGIQNPPFAEPVDDPASPIIPDDLRLTPSRRSRPINGE